jgi:hypothetical protein
MKVVEKPLPPHELLKAVREMEGLSFRIEIGDQPSFSTIFIYDCRDNTDICEIHARMWIFKDLEVFARHTIRFLRAYGFEIFRTEYFERQKHQCGLYFDNGGFVPEHVIKED